MIPELIHAGDPKCCPIPRDSPNRNDPDSSKIRAINATEKCSPLYSQSSQAQEMMKSETTIGKYTYISIPFSRFCSCFGAYICLHAFPRAKWSCPPSYLIFTFTSYKKKKIALKYEFSDFKNWNWFFLPIDPPDPSSQAQEMMKSETTIGKYTYISIPFSRFCSCFGAYICLHAFPRAKWSCPPSYLIFTFTSYKKKKIALKYEFSDFKNWNWFFLPIDPPDPVIRCEITGKGREKDHFSISSLIFFRDETDDETIARLGKQKLWSESPVVKPEFVKEADKETICKKALPHDPRLIFPSFSRVTCKNDSVSKESDKYDMSSKAQKMLKGEDFVELSHLSIPFPLRSIMKGAYICVNRNCSSPSLLFTFTSFNGKKTSKKYEFTRPKHLYEWYYLPIDLPHIVSCEIEGKGIWNAEHECRRFYFYPIAFVMPEVAIAGPDRFFLLPWEHSKDEEEKDTIHL
ncbi:hypothetical protein ADUPG1_007357 [Aduncisulcus paluster]|uniref:Uncharacterized protein n=1 Tax=Aduncisulcus paluster TaxID=2918883 RepID=A0ABQ5KNF5_9EUKA|nr:hypothetical protein ADUPG1_007357 [Aduncisulcus paluster]